jgi:DNA-nicking Smr family endonuclease
MSAPPRDRSGRRPWLTPEDEEVWRAVTRTLKPLKPGHATRDRANAPPPPASPAQSGRPATPMAALLAARPQPPAPARKPPPRIQPIEDKIKRRLARGRLSVDMKLDLHGMRQHEAHDALLAFIHRARGQGARIVTVVTGKGRGSRPEHEFHAQPGGVLQRMVRHWLAAPELRHCVIGFDEADAAHGGSGALYVRIRRDREDRP